MLQIGSDYLHDLFAESDAKRQKEREEDKQERQKEREADKQERQKEREEDTKRFDNFEQHLKAFYKFMYDWTWRQDNPHARSVRPQ